MNIADGFGYRKSKAVAFRAGCWSKPLEQPAIVERFPVIGRIADHKFIFSQWNINLSGIAESIDHQIVYKALK